MSEKDQKPKKNYQSPKLRLYGDVRTVTQAVMTSGVLEAMLGSLGMKTAV